MDNNHGHNGYSWLKCGVASGIFPNEYAVETEVVDGRLISMFVDKEFVREREGLLRIVVLEKGLESILVYLPAYPLEITSRAISVLPEKVVEPSTDY